MRIPEFTAEAALERPIGPYRTTGAAAGAFNQVVPQQCREDHGHCTVHGGTSRACVGSYCQECSGTGWLGSGKYAWVQVCAAESSRGCGICWI
jgi:hypothetical protein